MAAKRTRLLEVHPRHPEPRKIREAVRHLTNGEVIVYPTDTIYGLGADIESRAAIDRVYDLRRLDRKKPLSIVCSDLSEASRYAIIDNECFRFMRRVLPGPYTFVLRATREAPRTGERKRRAVGIRVPDSPVSMALVNALGRPILSSSAILGDEDPHSVISDPHELADQYAGGAALVLDAGLLEGTPSTVIDWSDEQPVVLRKGAGEVGDL